MRTTSRVRWACFALALTILVPAQLAVADGKTKRSISECTSFDQKDRDAEDGVDLSVQNNCTVAVSCHISWDLTCAPDSKKRRSRKSESHAFALDSDNGLTLTASASRCGDDSWSIDDISWSCEPKKD